MLPNGASAATVFLGAMYGGYVVSPINLLAQDAQLEYTLAHSDTRLVFATADDRARLEVIRERTGAAFDIRVVGVDGLELPDAPEAASQSASAGDPAMLMYTSGTTGLPKGVLHSDNTLLANGRAMVQDWQHNERTVLYSHSPLSHHIGTVAVDKTDKEIVKTIISLAHALGMRVVAEGVDSAEAIAAVAELERHYERLSSPFLTAEKFRVPDIIDPRDTRRVLCHWIEDAWRTLPEQLGPRGRTMRK